MVGKLSTNILTCPGNSTPASRYILSAKVHALFHQRFECLDKVVHDLSVENSTCDAMAPDARSAQCGVWDTSSVGMPPSY